MGIVIISCIVRVLQTRMTTCWMIQGQVSNSGENQWSNSPVSGDLSYRFNEMLVSYVKETWSICSVTTNVPFFILKFHRVPLAQSLVSPFNISTTNTQNTKLLSLIGFFRVFFKEDSKFGNDKKTRLLIWGVQVTRIRQSG